LFADREMKTQIYTTLFDDVLKQRWLGLASQVKHGFVFRLHLSLMFGDI